MNTRPRLGLRSAVILLGPGLTAALLTTGCSDAVQTSPTRVDPAGKTNRLGQPQSGAPDAPPTAATLPPPGPRSAPAERTHAQHPPAEVDRLVAEARQLIAADQYPVAMQRLLQCANRTPVSARCDGELGILYSKDRARRVEALYHLRATVELPSTDGEPDLFRRVSERLRALAEIDLAFAAVDRAIALSDDPEYLIARARILQGDPRRRLEAAETIAEARAKDDRPEWLREEAVLRGQVSDQLERARELFEELAKRRADDPATVERIRARISALDAQIASRDAAGPVAPVVPPAPREKTG